MCDVRVLKEKYKAVFGVILLWITGVQFVLYPCDQGQTDHWGTRALPKGPGSVRDPMRCFFGCSLSVGKDTGAP
ncbi:unnamed protein product [Staurois parvus]|uniref:Uncharacterized protein n=1 Tax=Staurois parvus TaxID=386267 RepID=A0ABN9CSP9_9NEOB|nr:unnamed protein product [Staurois parvus]